MSAVLGARPAGPVICVTEIPRITRQDRFMAAGTVDVAGFDQCWPSLRVTTTEDLCVTEGEDEQSGPCAAAW